MKSATETAISVHHLRSTTTSLLSRDGLLHALYEPPRARPANDLPTASPARLRLPRGVSGDRQVPRQERHDLPPQLRCRDGAVAGAVVGEERMAGALIHVHFD